MSPRGHCARTAVSTAQIVVFMRRDTFFARLCRVFTGCYAYHVAFLVQAGEGGHDWIYEMNWMRRRRISTPRENVTAYVFPAPVAIYEQYLIDQLKNRASHYGFADYLGFMWRPVAYLFKRTVPNGKGEICSEMVNIDLIEHGFESPWPIEGPPPSPCDWFKLLGGAREL